MSSDGLATGGAALQVDTEVGTFTIALDEARAAETCRYFRELATRGALDGGAVFRITTEANCGADVPYPIHVIQVGTRNGLDERREVIHHEPTSDTGLRHRRFTVSASRFAPGELYASFFVCLRDEPALDAGGGRRADGLGYAAFGEVVDGKDTVEALYDMAESAEVLGTPIPVRRVAVVAATQESETGQDRDD